MGEEREDRADDNVRATPLVKHAAPQIQRLTVGAANDPAEHAADVAAAEALRRIGTGTANGLLAGAVERADAAGRIMARHQPEAVGFEGGDVGPETAAVIGRARRSGRPLESNVRRTMESGFGADFSNVRVHVGPDADAANSALQSEAFTAGRDVFFRRDTYKPATSSGQHLLAHELAHTVQQGAAPAINRRVRAAAVRERPRPMEKSIASATTIRRSLATIDPKLGNKKWALLGAMIESYNKSPIDSARFGQLDAIARAAATYANPGVFGRIGAGSRIQAAKALLAQIANERRGLDGAIQDRMLKEASTARANDSFVENQAKERKASLKPGKLNLGTLGGTIPGADFGAVADLFTQGRDETKGSEELIEFNGRTGEAESNIGFMKKKGEVVITVNVPFTGESGHDGTIQAALDEYWNVFQAEYKGPLTDGSRQVKGAKGKSVGVKVIEAPPPATGVVDIKFKVGKSSGPATKSGKTPVQDSHNTAGGSAAATPVKDRFGVKVVSPVFLFTGNHPNWQSRMHLGRDGAKTRSDAGNWRMNDQGVKRMVAHEFGHLIGLNDEYSQTHGDIAATTGKKSDKYDFDAGGTPMLKGSDKTDYDKLKGGFTNSTTKAEALMPLAEDLKAVYNGDPERFAFLSAHFYEHDAAGIVGAKRHFGSALKVFVDWWEPKTTKAANEAAKRQTDWSKGSVKDRAKMKDAGHGDAHADEAKNELARQVKALADPNGYDINWMWYSGAGFRSGGLMGDYTTIDSGAEDVRYNAVAHDHKHPLEPRHVKRFVDLLSVSRGEKWEAKHK